MFFRVEGGDRRRIQLCGVERVAGDKVEGHFESPIKGIPKANPELWPPTQRWPLGDIPAARNEFSVFEPTNAAVWQLRVVVARYASGLERLRWWPHNVWFGLDWNNISLLSMLSATRAAWNAGATGGGSFWVESDLITNRSFSPKPEP